MEFCIFHNWAHSQRYEVSHQSSKTAVIDGLIDAEIVALINYIIRSRDHNIMHFMTSQNIKN